MRSHLIAATCTEWQCTVQYPLQHQGIRLPPRKRIIPHKSEYLMSGATAHAAPRRKRSNHHNKSPPAQHIARSHSTNQRHDDRSARSTARSTLLSSDAQHGRSATQNAAKGDVEKWRTQKAQETRMTPVLGSVYIADACSIKRDVPFPLRVFHMG